MKTPKPGQLCTINNTVYRAKSRTTSCGCFGCDLDDIALCPNIVDSRNGVKMLNCVENNIILKRINNC